MKTIKENWKIITIITGIIGVLVGVAIMFWDNIDDVTYQIRNK